MNFKDYCKTEESLKNNGSNSSNQGKKIKDGNDLNNNLKNEKLYKSVEEKLKDYSAYNKEELLQEFIKESGKAKQTGMYNDDKLENIKSVLFPYLDENQKKYFEQLINMVK